MNVSSSHSNPPSPTPGALKLKSNPCSNKGSQKGSPVPGRSPVYITITPRDDDEDDDIHFWQSPISPENQNNLNLNYVSNERTGKQSPPPPSEKTKVPQARAQTRTPPASAPVPAGLPTGSAAQSPLPPMSSNTAKEIKPQGKPPIATSNLPNTQSSDTLQSSFNVPKEDELDNSYSSFGFNRDRTPSLPATSVRNSVPNTARDARDETVAAIKYRFDLDSMTWKQSPIRLTVRHPNRGIGQDDLFVFFSVLIKEDIHYKMATGLATSDNDDAKLARPIPMLGRMFRHNIDDVSEDDYFGLAQSQFMCEELVKHYNQSKHFASEISPPVNAQHSEWMWRPLPMLTNRFLVRIPTAEIPKEQQGTKRGFFSYHTEKSKELFLFLEPDVVLCDMMSVTLTPTLTEYRNAQSAGKQDPHVFENSICFCSYPRGELSWEKQDYAALAESFSHYTHTCTNHKILACGMRRGSGFLTDPLLNSIDRKQFGMENGGLKEITKWAVRHNCNDICKMMRLPPPRTVLNDGETGDFSSFMLNSPSYYTTLAAALYNTVPSDFALEEEDEEDAGVEFEDPNDAAEPEEEEVATELVVENSPRQDGGWDSPKTMKTLEARKSPAATTKLVGKAPTSPAPPTTLVRSAAKTPVVSPVPITPLSPAAASSKSSGDNVRKVKKKSPSTTTTSSTTAAANKVSPPVGKKEVDDDPVFASTYSVVIAPTSARKKSSVSGTPSGKDAPSGSFGGDSAKNSISSSPKRKKSPGTSRKGSVAVVSPTPSSSSGRTPRGNKTSGGNTTPRNGRKSGFMAPTVSSEHKVDNVIPNVGEAKANSNERTEAGAPEKFKPTASGSSYLKADDRQVKRKRRSSSASASSVKVPSQRYTGTDAPPKKATPAAAPQSTKTESSAAPAASPAPLVTTPRAADVIIKPKRQPPAAPPPVAPQPERKSADANAAALPMTPPKPEAFSRSQSESVLTLSRSKRKEDEQNGKEPKLFDMKNVYPATKYKFDMRTLMWRASRTYIRVCNPDCGVAQGGMRVCFDVNEVDPADPHSEEVLNVAKMYRRNISKVVEEDYFNEGEVQILCAAVARDFNQALFRPEVTGRNRHEMEMMECSVCFFDRNDLPPELQITRKGFFSYRTTDTHKVYFTMEPKLVGNFTKYNGNFGEAYPTNERPLPVDQRLKRLQIFEVAEAFSHYSLLVSEGGLLVCDIQGVENRLTDPEMHTHNREGMGIGNMGMDGIKKFIENHKCTRVCKMLGFKPFSDESGVPQFKETAHSSNKYINIVDQLSSLERSTRIERAPDSYSRRST